MKAATLKRQEEKLHLKVVNNKLNRKKSVYSKIHINTLIPNFKYTNECGEISSPSNQVLL
jgi:hypothetical protein